MERWTWGRMQNPIRGLLHGVAAIASAVGLVLLVLRASGRGTAAAIVFGVALLGMYTVSAVYHSVPWGDRWKPRIQRVDHSMIFLVVAGTATPIAVASLDSPLLWVVLAVTWSLAVAGIVLKLFLPRVRTGLSVTIQMVMGWSAILWLPLAWIRLGTAAIALIAAGGLAYTAGVVVFASRRPRLLTRSFSHHELFHLLVVTGSTAHFFAVLYYALPAAV